jgi:hypothetical protein
VLTCGGLEQELASSAAVRTTEDCVTTASDVEFLASIVDIAALCGCPNAPTPNACTLCGDGSTLLSNKILPGVENELAMTTCGTVAELAPFVTNPESCDTFRINFALGCCDDGSQSACAICPPGSTMGAPSQVLSKINGLTCAELDSSLSFTPSEECFAIRASLLDLEDLETACQCQLDISSVAEEESGAEGCQLCSNTTKWMKPGYNIGDFEIPRTNGWTCGTLATRARATDDDSTVCQDELIPLARGCCSDYQYQRCSVCPDGSNVENPGRPLILHGEQTTCGELDFKTGFLSTEGDECQMAQTDFGLTLFNIASWCGCPGVDIPDECSLCESDFEVGNPDWVILGTADTTCDYGELFARHVVDKEYCDSEVATIAAQCCVRRPSEAYPVPDLALATLTASTAVHRASNLVAMAMSPVIVMLSLFESNGL